MVKNNKKITVNNISQQKLSLKEKYEKSQRELREKNRELESSKSGIKIKRIQEEELKKK